MTSHAPSDLASVFPLQCPLCGSPLAVQAAARRCQAGHTFDIAREGYVNLLPSQHVRRGSVGDSAEMLQARRRFLGAGHYAPLLDAIVSPVTAHVTTCARRPARLLEVGCGDGHFIGGVSARLGAAAVAGASDIAKAAVRLAARAHPQLTAFVADTQRQLCVPDAAVDVLLNVLSPRNPAEFARVIAPGGVALVVLPTDAHLASLRPVLGLLGVQPDKESLVRAAFADTFTLRERTPLDFPLMLDAAAVHDLVRMGPSSHHVATAAIADDQLRAAAASPVQAAFVLLVLERNAG